MELWLRHWNWDQPLAVSNPSSRAFGSDNGKVINIYVYLSPSRIIWYRPKGGDTLQLWRWPWAATTGFMASVSHRLTAKDRTGISSGCKYDTAFTFLLTHWLCDAFSQTDRLWCGVQRGRRRFARCQRTSSRTTSRSTSGHCRFMLTTTSCRSSTSATKKRNHTSKWSGVFLYQ